VPIIKSGGVLHFGSELRILEDIGTKTLAYLYDFGDGWEHTIKIEHLADPEPGVLYPRQIEVSGRCPPEDCGGPWGYAELLEPSRIPSTNATPNSRNGSATTSIPTPTKPKGSPRKSPPSPKLGLGSPPANARDAANPRPSPDAYHAAQLQSREACAEKLFNAVRLVHRHIGRRIKARVVPHHLFPMKRHGRL
jgi:hypothetical protein